MKTVLLLGDSITEQGYCSGWVSNVSDALIRRAYVVNSGLSGYNTRWILQLLNDAKSYDSVIPPWVQEPLFVTLMLGTNDSAENGQGVPLAEYRDNLRAIVDIVLTKVKPVGGVFVLTPPPVQETLWNFQHPDGRRSYTAARSYRQAALEVASEAGKVHPQKVHPVDIQRAFLEYGAPGATEDDMDKFNPQGAWTTLMDPDGMHINPLGGQLVSATVLSAVRNSPQGSKVLQNDKTVWPLLSWEDMMEKHAAQDK
ncbi:putative esterase [Leptomonas pyrrhocoris]|uniref:Putative esterase n=1 Tax=Leptomonas pyrrhocoris TaxID=157538 RepID=A0A0M9FQA4_LEPPY|nr:putative esterase [Leptomonas pyrrhocoris]KPA73793.1 putative esterase [Leptomonas pyrrhocoris]|eukprot:XP_015652232.1 putative esterase [Leptomonas pyrrhocoris]